VDCKNCYSTWFPPRAHKQWTIHFYVLNFNSIYHYLVYINTVYSSNIYISLHPSNSWLDQSLVLNIYTIQYISFLIKWHVHPYTHIYSIIQLYSNICHLQIIHDNTKSDSILLAFTSHSTSPLKQSSATTNHRTAQ